MSYMLCRGDLKVLRSQSKQKAKWRQGQVNNNMLYIVVKSCETLWNQWLRPMKTYVHLTDQCAWVYVSCCATPVCRDWQASPKELLGCDLRNPATLRVGMHVEFQLGELLMGDGLWDEGVFKSPWQGYHIRIIEQFVKYRKHVQASSDSSPGANSKRQQIQVVKFSDWCLGLLQNDSLLGIPDWDQEVADEVLFASIWSSILSQLSCMWKVEIRTTSNLLVCG